MLTSVNLQEPFSYSIYPIIILSILVIINMVYIIIIKIHKKNENKTIEIIETPPKNLNAIKQKYIKKINYIEQKLKEQKISVRTAYQGLSSVIRYFVYEVTNIKVQNCTLKDIEKLNFPILYELIQEYYAPEFAKMSYGNIQESLEKTRKVIEKWA